MFSDVLRPFTALTSVYRPGPAHCLQQTVMLCVHCTKFKLDTVDLEMIFKYTEYKTNQTCLSFFVSKVGFIGQYVIVKVRPAEKLCRVPTHTSHG